MKLQMCFLVLFVMSWSFAYTQENENKIASKNRLDIQLFGNKGFISVGYNRTILEYKLISFTLTPSIGYVPGSHDTSNGDTPFPSFTHLNLGTDIVLGHSLNQLSTGVSYSKIILGRDPINVRPKSNYTRVLGDISYIRHFKHDPLALKISFAPILYDNGADDVENIPIAFAFRISL